jgi:hypothetical protein
MISCALLYFAGSVAMAGAETSRAARAKDDKLENSRVRAGMTGFPVKSGIDSTVTRGARKTGIRISGRDAAASVPLPASGEGRGWGHNPYQIPDAPKTGRVGGPSLCAHAQAYFGNA